MHAPSRMPRPPRQKTSDFPYHISARCTNREWFKIPLPEVWKIFEDYLWSAHHFYGLRTHAFVLMSNHFHLIASTPSENLDACMRHLMTETSRQIGKRARRINQVYGAPYHASLIRDSIYLEHCHKYVYRNPVQAKICQRAEDYPYSTLRGLIGGQNLAIPTLNQYIEFTNSISVEKTLAWINEAYQKETYEALRKGLRKKVFAVPTRAMRKSKKTGLSPRP